MSEPLTESQVRALRDEVYGKPANDESWQACRDNWMRPDSVAWLIEKAKTKITI